jgi:surfactin synthase thioesterase subunit
LGQLGGTPDAVLANGDLMQLALPALRADFEASDRYAYEVGPQLTCPVFIYAGLFDAIVPSADVEGWGKESTEDTVIRKFPGAHFFLHTAKEMVTRVLARDLLIQIERMRVSRV